MKNNNYNGGRMVVSYKSGGNRYVTSSIIDDPKSSAIAVISAILLLAIITSVLFVVLADDFSFPSWSEIINSGKVDTSNGPYATVTNKNKFVASAGGREISSLNLYSENAILIRVSDMTTLAHKGADDTIYPASMTKVMTVVVALDYIKDMDETYLITNKIISTMPSGASNAGLFEFVGQKMSFRDLLYGVTYLSAADSVLCVIDALGFTQKEFVGLMNKKAQEIGLQNTTFGGAIGMDEEHNQTTCRDMAAIMVYAMENPVCRELFGGTQYRTQSVNDVPYYNSTLHTGINDFDENGFDANPETVLEGYTILAAKSGFEVKPGYCLVSYIENKETKEKFVLVTAYAEAYKEPYRKTRIYDMISIFKSIKP